MKNITLTADADLIEAARAQALAEGSSLNEQFRLWLGEYTRKQRAREFRALMDELAGQVDTGGRTFTRDEMNER